MALVDYRFEGTDRWGAGSRSPDDFGEGAHARVFREPNERFRLPVDGDRDIIMIGPGTGVAPFRAFVQHRVATGARVETGCSPETGIFAPNSSIRSNGRRPWRKSSCIALISRSRVTERSESTSSIGCRSRRPS